MKFWSDLCTARVARFAFASAKTLPATPLDAFYRSIARWGYVGVGRGQA